MLPMSTARKNGEPILAKIREDLSTYRPGYAGGRGDSYAGRKVVVRHPGLSEDGFDIGWSLAGPFGFGLGEDEIFEGWWPLPEDDGEAAEYRLLTEDDTVTIGDQYLADDSATWLDLPAWDLSMGGRYVRSVYVPMRRRIDVQKA